MELVVVWWKLTALLHCVTGTGAVCDQKILVFVLQMKKSEQEHMDGVRKESFIEKRGAT
jgi:hypothetical protein